jgi:hypothetical protein
MASRSPHPRRLSAPLAAGTRAGEPDPGNLSARALWAAARRRFGARTLAGLAASALVSAVAPLILYDQLQQRVGSQVTALLITSVIPVAWTAGKLAVRRRVDPIGLLAIAGVVVGLVLLALTGGNPFALKIRDAVIAGAVGVACLGSMLIRRPLVLPLLPKSRPWIPGMTRRTAANWLTGIWGVVLVAEAAVITLLAAVLPASTFLAVHKPAALAFVALGIGGVIWRKRHRPARPDASAEAGS